jgi:hypothetical protein
MTRLLAVLTLLAEATVLAGAATMKRCSPCSKSRT